MPIWWCAHLADDAHQMAKKCAGRSVFPTDTLGGVLRFASETLVPLMHLILETICKTREAWGGE